MNKIEIMIRIKNKMEQNKEQNRTKDQNLE